MAPIPLPLTLSNASTLLTWLCVYIPHSVLLSLLVLGTIFVTLLAIVALAGCYHLLKKGLCFLKRLAQKTTTFAPRPQKSCSEPRSRTELRHRSCPVHSLPLRCPHCQADLTSPTSPTERLLEQELVPEPVPRILPLRRHSDLTPPDHAPLSPTPFAPHRETRITTPPRKGDSPVPDPIRRSPRPHKPRKLDD